MTLTVSERRTEAATSRSLTDDPLRFERAVSRPRLSGRRTLGLLLLTLVLTAVGAQAGYFSANLFDTVWQARTEIEYRGNSWTETEDVAVKSRSLTAPIAEAYGVEIKEFEEDLTAGLVAGTQILRIEYFDTDAELAQNVVSDLAEAYIADASERPPEGSRELLELQLSELEDELDSAKDELESGVVEPGQPLTPTQQDIQSEIASLRARIGVLELRLLDSDLELQDVEARGLPRYVTRPFVFEEPYFPRPLRLGLLGAALGALLGLVPLVLNMYRPEGR